MNTSVLATLLGVAALSVGKSGSNARSVFSSDKAKKRFEQLNGYRLDDLAQIMLEQYMTVFMNLHHLYDYLENRNIDHSDRQHYREHLFSNFGFSFDPARFNNLGIKYKVNEFSTNPDGTKLLSYDILIKNLMGREIALEAIIQEDRISNKDERKKQDTENDRTLTEFLNLIESEDRSTYKSFYKWSRLVHEVTSRLKDSFYVNDSAVDDYKISIGFKFLSRTVYQSFKDLLLSDPVALEIFEQRVLGSIRHELIHVIELQPNWNNVSSRGNYTQYFTSRGERRTWGQNIVEEVMFLLRTLKKAEELFPDENPVISRYGQMKFQFSQGLLGSYLELTSIRQIIPADLLNKTLDWIYLPGNQNRFSEQEDIDAFISATFPVFKSKSFKHWQKMVETEIKDNSAGAICMIGGKGGNQKTYKSFMEGFFKRCKRNSDKPIICLITSASKDKDAGKQEAKMFRDMGAEVRVFKKFFALQGERRPTLQGERRPTLRGCDGIFFTGGDQQRLMDSLSKSDKEEIVKKHKAGVHIGGSSAGAAIMGRKMIASGNSTPVISEGLGLLRSTIIDQHFSNRNRESRLRIAVEKTGFKGVGIDEDTMITVWDDGYSQVDGDGKVFVYCKKNGDFDLVDFEDGEASVPGFIM